MGVYKFSEAGTFVQPRTLYKSMLAGNEAFVVEQAFELIESAVLTSAQSSVTFSNLGTYSSTYKHLQIRIAARGNRSGLSQDVIRIYVNNDNTLLQNAHFFLGNGSTVSSTYESQQNYFILIDGATSTANAFGAGVVDILDAYSTTKNKVFRALSGHVTGDKRIGLSSMLWRNTNSITELRLQPFDTTFTAGSRFSLYGIKG
jgi:hypothetical protein